MNGRPFPKLAELSKELVIGKVLYQEERLVGDHCGWIGADPLDEHEWSAWSVRRRLWSLDWRMIGLLVARAAEGLD
jgi:hypothetical protein